MSSTTQARGYEKSIVENRALSILGLFIAVLVLLVCIPLYADEESPSKTSESDLQELTTPAGHKVWFYCSCR